MPLNKIHLLSQNISNKGLMEFQQLALMASMIG